MKKPNKIFNFAVLFCITLVNLTVSFAQTQTQPRQFEPSYEVVLNVLTASNDSSDKTSVPQTLSNVVKKLKNSYSFSNYLLDSTYLGRIGSAGNFEYKGVSNRTNQNQETYAPIFSEWTLNNLRNSPDSQGKNFIEFQNFRFGQRVPIILTNNAANVTSSAVNYEQIGLTMQNLSLPEGVPTVIGSLAASKPDELMFLVLTVKPAEQ